MSGQTKSFKNMNTLLAAIFIF